MTLGEKERASSKEFVRHFKSTGRNGLANVATVIGGIRMGIISTIEGLNPIQSPKSIRANGQSLANTSKKTGSTILMSQVINNVVSEAKANQTRDAQDWWEFGTIKAIEFGTAAYGEGLLSRSGGSKVPKVLGDASHSKITKPSTRPLKNLSGSIEESANLARKQPYGPNTNVFRRLPTSAQDIQALAEAQAGMGRKLPLTLGDSRYLGWEKWHHSVGPKGSKSVVHYLRNPQTGFLTDFKFK